MKVGFMIDLRRLAALRAVRQEGTVTEAASTLHLSASAVSQQIKQLEHELGVQLLVREGRRVHPTEVALKLLEHADVIYAEWERTKAELDQYAIGSPGVLKLSGFPSAISSLLAPAAAMLQAEHRYLKVRITEAETDACFSRLLAQETDIAILMLSSASSPTPKDPRFEQIQLFEEPLDLLVSNENRLAKRGSIRLSDASREDWIAPAAGTIDHLESVQAYCASAGFVPHIVHEAKEWDCISALVAGGFGVCLFPRFVATRYEGSVTRLELRAGQRVGRRLLACIRRGSGGQPHIDRGLRALEAISRALHAQNEKGSESGFVSR
jgi:DNA-binding transcriptional LysR family regulator